MINLSYFNKFILGILLFVLIFPQLVFSDEVTNPANQINLPVFIFATVNAPGSGGGGGGGGGGLVAPTTINFSGMSYPSTKVTILNNGKVAVTTISDPNARFSSSLSNLATGTYNFSVFGEDVQGRKSLSFSFPVYVTQGTTVNIGGIFLSPTIDTDKSEVKKGDNLLVFGQTVPNTSLDVVFHSDQEILRNTITDATGLYKYNMNTTPLEFGNHNVKSKAVMKEDISASSAEVPFLVGLTSKQRSLSANCSKLRGDLNCDGRVNLVDFSIMAYWYKKLSPPARIDLNGDGKVTLVDFSIMAYNWTG